MKLLKQSIVLTFSKGIRAVATLIFTMYVARAFSKFEFGTYKQIMLIANIFVGILPMGIPLTVSYYYKNLKSSDINKLISNSIIWLNISSIIASIILILVKVQIGRLVNNVEIVKYIYLLVMYILIIVISSFYENLFICSNSTKSLAIIYLVYSVAYVLFPILVIKTTKNLFYLMIIIDLLECIRVLAMSVFIFRKLNFKFIIDYAFLKKQFLYAVPLGLASIVQVINGYIDNITISKFYSPAEYAVYAVGATDIPLIGIITVSVTSVILPIMSKAYNSDNNKKKMIHIWKEAMVSTSLVIFPIFFILLYYHNGYIEFIFSKQYLDSAKVFVVYLLKFPLAITTFSTILIIIGNNRYILVNTIIIIILNIILNIIFVNIFGFIGPAISNCTVQFIGVYLQLSKIKKSINIKISNLIPYKKLLFLFILAWAICFIVYKTSRLVHLNDISSFFVLGTVSFVLIQGVYYKLGFIKIKR